MTTADERAARFLTFITYLRILLTPVVMALVLHADRWSWAIPTAAVLFAFAALTDFADGRLARRWKQTTTFGTFLDTTADKLLVSGVLIALVADRAGLGLGRVHHRGPGAADPGAARRRERRATGRS